MSDEITSILDDFDEYTGIDAQHDTDYYAEAYTFAEYDELQEKLEQERALDDA